MMSDAEIIDFARDQNLDSEELMDMSRRERLISEEIYLCMRVPLDHMFIMTKNGNTPREWLFMVKYFFHVHCK